MDVPKQNFDEMFIIVVETFTHIKAQARTADINDALNKQLSMIFQWVFERLDEIKYDSMLTSEVRPSNAIGGEKKQVQWKSNSDYALRDKSTDEEIIEVETLEVDDDEEDLVEDVILGLRAIGEPPTKVLSKAKK